MRKPFQKVVVALLALLLLCGAMPAFALENVKIRTVRIGFYRSEGYHVMDENGLRSGYGYDILQTMKLYNNWRYEYVGYDKGWADIQQMLLDGEIDMVVSAVKTPARMELYDFADRPLAQSGACLMVKAGDSPYTAGQYDSYNGMRIGFIENSAQIASTEIFAKENGFTYTPVYYKTSGELEQAVRSGTDVDAIVTSNMRIIAGTRRLELFAMQDVYAMVKKGNAELLAEINHAMECISLYNTNLFETLYNKYYSVETGDAVFFSPAETAFIRQCQENGVKLRAALAPDMSPYAYYDGDTPRGILYDIVDEALKRSRIAYELVYAETDAEYYHLIEDVGVDVRLVARYDHNYAEEIGYTLTDPYYTTDVSRVTRKGDDGEIKTVASIRNHLIDRLYLPTIIEDETILYFDSSAACMEAVLGGTCDALYTYTRSAQEMVYTDVTNRLTSVIMPRFNVGFSIGVREDADARLASILAKAVNSLNEEDIGQMVLAYTDYDVRSASLVGLLYSDPIYAVAIVALLLVLIFGAVMLVLGTRQRRFEREKNRQLQEALEAAEQANTAKSVFMSRMSHEIRTPLNAIIGYNSISSNTLSEAKGEHEYRQAAMKTMDCLSKSDIASKHLLTVINDVLDMSAIESGKIRIAREPFDFKSMVSSLTVLFFSQARTKGVDFDVAFDTPTEEWFIGDQMRINQVITNLLSNAVKFTPDSGNIRMMIHQTNLNQDSARIRFEITDTGIGMSESFLTNIWAPFEQADASISRRFGGTGLGLSITKNLVDLMDGAISVQSKLGEGTTFTVELTLTRMEQPSGDTIYDFTEVNVLVADDDRGICDYMKLLFSRYSVQCTTVFTGESAVAAVKSGIVSERPFTACVIDWQMPGMDGITTVRRIREIVGPGLPIIVISAYDYADIEDAAREAGVDAFVPKPIFQSTVFDLLSKVSGKRRAAQEVKEKQLDFGGARVLLAEDNRMNMEIAKEILESSHLAVDQAWNGKEAVERFVAAPAGTYRAILMDVHMPEMDGYRATRMIRASAHPEAATIPIIAMTADVFAEDVAEATAAGMNAHIGKPIERELLFETLRRFIPIV